MSQPARAMRPWTEAETEQLRELAAKHCRTDIQAMIGRSRSDVVGHAYRHRIALEESAQKRRRMVPFVEIPDACGKGRDYVNAQNALVGLTDEDLSARFRCERRAEMVSEQRCAEAFTNAYAFGRRADPCYGCRQGAALRLRIGFDVAPTDELVDAMLVVCAADDPQNATRLKAARAALGLGAQ